MKKFLNNLKKIFFSPQFLIASVIIAFIIGAALLCNLLERRYNEKISSLDESYVSEHYFIADPSNKSIKEIIVYKEAK